MVGEEDANIVADSKKQLESSWRALQKDPYTAHTQGSCIEGATCNVNYRHVIEDNIKDFQCKALRIESASKVVSHCPTHLHKDLV